MKLYKKTISLIFGIIILLITYNEANGITDYRCDVNCSNNSFTNLQKLRNLNCDFAALIISNFSQDSINLLLDSLKPDKKNINTFYLYNIESVYFKSLNLDSLPIVSKLGCIYNYYDEINMFPNVKRITFNDCEIKSIGGLGSMELLNLIIYDSFYLGFPKGLEDQKNLINLSISWQFDEFYKEKYPDEFVGLDVSLRRFKKRDNLTSLEIIGYQHDSIPDYIMDLTNLRYLKINGKNLTTIPHYLESHKNLYYIDISYWGLIKLPDWIFNSKKKYLLDINEEQMKENWEKIQKSSNLTIKYDKQILKRAD